MFGSIKAAYDVAKDVQALQISTEVKTAIADILGNLVDARSEAVAIQEREAALLQEIRGLKEKIRELEAWGDEKEHYQLHAIGRGAFAYMLKPAHRPDTPAHWLCTQCYGGGKKSVMQFQGPHKAGPRDVIHGCPSCQATFVTANWVHPKYDAEEDFG